MLEYLFRILSSNHYLWSCVASYAENHTSMLAGNFYYKEIKKIAYITLYTTLKFPQIPVHTIAFSYEIA